MKPTYEPQIIEKSLQKQWEDEHTFGVDEDLNTEKFYCLSMLPYPSGNIHMGHVRNYTIGDVIARYKRAQGKNVLQPLGWDAFGLPAENAALEKKLPPSSWTRNNIKQMRAEIKRLGFAIDWKRELSTCDPDYYRWEQWLFIQMYKHGLVYRKKAVVNWDPIDQTVLANEQVVNGCGWRSGAPVERREISQWFLKITEYADELLDYLDKLEDWPEQVRTMQRNWIGKSKGIELTFGIENQKQTLSVFTTRPDTVMGVTYVAIAPMHPLAMQAAQNNKKIAAFIEKCNNIKVAESEIATIEKEGIPTGFNVIHPITGEPLPIWTANFVLMEYGSGAVMAVPAHDQRDFEFAQKYTLPIKQVIVPEDGSSWDFTEKAYTEKGILVNSAQFNRLSSNAAFDAIGDFLSAQRKGCFKTHYRLRDWGISRQRYWGTPIPFIYCNKCGIVPVAEQDLPVILPENVTIDKPGSPLADMPEFVDTTCPVCGEPAKREIDTFDTFMESSWYYARYCCPDQNTAMLDDRAKYWTPVDQYVGGIEHAVMHLLYARFIHKVMRDLGLVNSDEPFTRLLTQGMVLKDGAKMSKSKGNTVAPKEIIDEYGADTARLFIIFTAPPEQSLEWSDSGVEGSYRFLKKLWNFAYSNHQLLVTANEERYKFEYEKISNEQKEWRRQIHNTLQQANFDMERLQFNTVVSAVMKILNIIQKISIKDETDKKIFYEGFHILLQLLAPITPHITHALWQELKFAGDIIATPWPKVDQRSLRTESIELVVQINGKLRGTISVPTETEIKEIEKIALKNENVQRYTDGKTIKKIIVLPKKLVNIVV